MLGWPFGADFSCLSLAEGSSLIGESVALPPLAAILNSMILNQDVTLWGVAPSSITSSPFGTTDLEKAKAGEAARKAQIASITKRRRVDCM